MATLIDQDNNSLIDNVLQGDQASRERLAALALERLRPFVYRITLQDDLTQDIVQETVIEMFKVLGKLQDKDKFWPWLRGIAFNKLRHHFRQEQRRRDLTSAVAQQKQDGRQSQDGLKQIIHQELEHIVMGAMKKLKSNYRAVLSMRCYEQMEYEQIASVLGSSEFATRMLFVRAKRALAKELSRHGLKKGMLLSALLIFGKMTAGNQAMAAQIQISPALLNAGTSATIATLAVSKTALTTVAAAGLVTVASQIYTPQHDDSTQSGGSLANKPVPASLHNPASGPAINETWYYYPGELSGPVMTRRLHTGGNSPQTLWLQNDRFIYHYQPNQSIVTLKNHHYWNPGLSVARLPGDSSTLTAALNRIEEKPYTQAATPPPGRDLLFVVKSTPEGSSDIQVSRQPHGLEEEFYQYNWPDGIRVVDTRDAIHRQGWAALTVTGQINGQPITGQGQIPLTYEQWQRIKPALTLQLAADRLYDSESGAGLRFTSKGTTLSWPAGHLLSTLGRPWTGLHTLDVIRRDAAAMGLTFKTQYRENGAKALIVLSDTTHGNLKLSYTVDLLEDWLVLIEAMEGDTCRARLSFDYHLSRPGQSAPIAPSGPITPGNPNQLWLLDLIDMDIR